MGSRRTCHRPLLVIALASLPWAAAAAAEPRPAAKVAAEVDRAIDRRLAEEKVPASPASSDSEFLRRVHLDLTGLLPSPDRVAGFLDSKDLDKRRKMIDALLDSPEFGRRFADYWTALFVKRNDANLRMNSAPFQQWLAGQLNKGVGWDKAVTEMMTASGDSPATLFLMTNREKDVSPSRTASTVGVLFLGIQLQCAECHDHPFTKWRREDFWGVAAFFARTKGADKRKSKDKGARPLGVHDVDESPREFVPRPDPKKPPPPPGPSLPAGVIEIPDATDTMKRVGRAKAKYLEGAVVGGKCVAWKPSATKAERAWATPCEYAAGDPPPAANGKYVAVGGAKESRLLDADSGKELATYKGSGPFNEGYVAFFEDKVLLSLDGSHGHSDMVVLGATPETFGKSRPWDQPHPQTTSYHGKPMTFPMVEGRVFFRGYDGVYCYDLRKR